MNSNIIRMNSFENSYFFFKKGVTINLLNSKKAKLKKEHCQDSCLAVPIPCWAVNAQTREIQLSVGAFLFFLEIDLSFPFWHGL